MSESNACSARSSFTEPACQDSDCGDKICDHQLKMLRLNKHARVKAAARLCVATILFSALTAGVLPLTADASGSLCQLSCCAGRAPHAAGSCMSESCQTFLRKSRRSAPKAEFHERLCGLTHRAHSLTSLIRTNPVALNSATRSGSSSRESQISTETMTKPCESGCGGGAASGPSGAYRQRNSAALSVLLRPKLPTPARHLDSRFASIETHSALCRRCAPRGPPSVHS